MVTGNKPNRGARYPAPLIAWIHGQKVGEWAVREGEHRFQYTEEWAALPGARGLSLSLPLLPGNAMHRGPVVANYFDNLLTDNDTIRRRLQSRFGTVSTEAFHLLAAVGAECAGAVQLLPRETLPTGFDRIDGIELDDAGVASAIDASLASARATTLPDGASGNRTHGCLAGAQEKTALLRRNGRWFQPLNSTPTTHILKLPLGHFGSMPSDMPDAVENEWLCSRVMTAFGLPTAQCDIATFGERKVLVVERFDRALRQAGTQAEWIEPLPQEDFCQALGLPGAKKYERDGGPGMREILRVLDGSASALADKTAFVKAQMVYWLLGAINGHAKSFSIFLEADNAYRLAPFRGALSAWPVMGEGLDQLAPHKARLAIALRSKSAHWTLADLLPLHWDGVAKQAGLGDARALCDELVTQLPGVLSSVEAQLPAAFPEHVARSIFDGMKTSGARLTEVL
jgi:serine/threonine-protein kinase HipA